MKTLGDADAASVLLEPHRWVGVFLPSRLPRAGRFALWRPDAVDGQDEKPSSDMLTVVCPGQHGLREATVPAVEVAMAQALPLLMAVDKPDAPPVPGLSPWASAARIALEAVVRGDVEPSADDEGDESWRCGRLDAIAKADLDALVAGFPPHAHAQPLPGGPPWRLPNPRHLLSSFMDAVVDTLLASAVSDNSAQQAGSSDSSLPAAAETTPHPAAAETGPAVRCELRVQHSEDTPYPVREDGAVDLVLQVRSLKDASLIVDAADLADLPATTDEPFGKRPLAAVSAVLTELGSLWQPLDRLTTNDDDEFKTRLTPQEFEELLRPRGPAQALRRRGVAILLPAEWASLESVAVMDAPNGSSIVDGLLQSFNWRFSLDGRLLTEEEMDQLAESRRPLVRLREGWALVNDTVLRRARSRLATQLEPGDALAAAAAGELVVDGESVPYTALGAAARLATQEPLLPALEEPPGLVATLRAYQRRGLAWLADRCSLGLGGCLADDMGLGKTVTVIALHLHRLACGEATGPTLVVGPSIVLDNWTREVERFAPGVTVRRFHGPSRSLRDLTPETIVVTTYGVLSDWRLARIEWGLVVADEAQRIKNPRSKTFSHICELNGQVRVALTGTPVENRLRDLWAILTWTTPGLLGSHEAFQERYVQPIENGEDPEEAEAAAERLARLVRPFVLRRMKTDPAIAPELPAKTETEHIIGLTARQTALYEATRREGMARIQAADSGARPLEVTRLLTHLKQICNHPVLFQGEGFPELTDSRKLELLDELLEQAQDNGESVLVFSQYTTMLDLIENHLGKHRPAVAYLRIDGKVPPAERFRRAERFQHKQASLMLLSVTAAGLGINLTQATQVIHYDRWWNPAVEDQATDRAYRIGQTRPVHVHKFVTRGTVEERIAELINRKRALAESVVPSDDSYVTRLTNAELDELLRLRDDAE
ncbi:DEAD/DEAH box helicase [Streptomyces sp. NPDC001634]|uniref:DEAD/DEAH box helicase n=1 Tax=Streptomyces sp. NPDC001634 TaxID=3154390 RepID=UPI003320082D